MSATFACPHCGTSYPVKPVLVGRAVRCTKCKNGFVLRDTGVADPLPMAGVAPEPATAPSASAPASAPAAAPTAPAPAPPPAPQRTAASAGRAPAAPPAAAVRTPESATDRAPSPEPPAAGKPGTDRHARLTRQQEEVRRAMAGTLASAAAAALKANAKAEEAEDTASVPSSSQRMAKARSSTGRQAKPRLSDIAVVDSGAREARTTRWFWICVALSCVALAALVVLLGLRSEPRRALDDFAAPVYGVSGRYPQRLGEMQRRAWISDGCILTELGSVRFGTLEHYELAAGRTVLAGTQGPRLARDLPALRTTRQRRQADEAVAAQEAA